MSAETLRKAAAIVRERGLARGTYEDSERRVCVYGAMALAHFDRVVSSLAEGDEVRDDAVVVASVLGVPIFGVVEWNDAYGRTAEEVAAVFEAAADRLEAA